MRPRKAMCATDGGSARGADALCLVLVAAAALMVLGKDMHSGALADADAAAHVMDGVLVRDWILAGPGAWMSPMEFARTQYGHYPTLGMGQHYPPGFAAVEAVFFVILGVNEWAARASVVFFGVLMAVGAYLFVRPLADRATAMLASAILLTFPATTLWGRQIMLEVPTMAGLVWAALSGRWYLARPNGKRLAGMLGCVLATVLLKQTAIFLIGAVAVTLVVAARGGAVARTHAVIACGAAVLALVGMVFSLDDACLKTLSGYDTYDNPLSLGAVTFYARATPYLAGTLVLAPAAVGVILCWRRDVILGALLAGWLAVSYAMVTTAGLKAPRFFYVGLFPLAVWAAMGIHGVLSIGPVSLLRRPALVAAAIALCVMAFVREGRDAPDYGPVVAAHLGDITGKPVLFSGLRDGDFVFEARRQLPWRKTTVIRGSKLFYTCTAGPDLDHVSRVASETALGDLMRRFAFETVFVERENVVGTAEDQWLRRYLRESGDYELQASHRVCGACGGLAQFVDVYRLSAPLRRTVEYYDIPMPRTGTPIRVSLKRQDTDGAS